jgi:hypothetical protein
MATVETANIRGLKIDPTVKGFALREYVFKNDCLTASMQDDGIRYYEETAADLEATAPSAISNVSPLSRPATLEVTWTRKTAYYKKYFVESFISREDIASAELPVLARTLLRLTRAVTKQVDAAIYSSASAAATGGNTFATTSVGGAAWDAASGQNPIADLNRAKRIIAENDYNPEGASLWLSPTDYESLVTWLISTKGTSIPNFSSDVVQNGTVMKVLGLNVKVSNNVTADEAIVIVPNSAMTWYSFENITSALVENEGIGSMIRVWEAGVPVVHEPKAVVKITNTQA